jgi:broad specificity phosphatase PhoE
MITVLLVRHADIDLPAHPSDPPLNAAGHRRAEVLAHVSGAAGVATLFTSSFLRTRQTAGPLAARLGLQPREVPPPAELAKQLWSDALGEVVLVVGHSNTVPEMIAALGAPPPLPVIAERDFDNLYVLTAAEPGDARMVSLKYGKPSS